MESQHKSSSQCSNIFAKGFGFSLFCLCCWRLRCFCEWRQSTTRRRLMECEYRKLKAKWRLWRPSMQQMTKMWNWPKVGMHPSYIFCTFKFRIQKQPIVEKQWSFRHIALNQAKISAWKRNKLVRGSWPVHHDHSVTILLAIRLFNIFNIFRQMLLCNKFAFLKRVRRILTG